MQRLRNQFGQNIIEYALLFTLVTAAVMVMGPYVIRAFNANIKGWDDSVQDSFQDPLDQDAPPGLVNIVCTGEFKCEEDGKLGVDCPCKGWGKCPKTSSAKIFKTNHIDCRENPKEPNPNAIPPIIDDPDFPWDGDVDNSIDPFDTYSVDGAICRPDPKCCEEQPAEQLNCGDERCASYGPNYMPVFILCGGDLEAKFSGICKPCPLCIVTGGDALLNQAAYGTVCKEDTIRLESSNIEMSVVSTGNCEATDYSLATKCQWQCAPGFSIQDYSHTTFQGEDITVGNNCGCWSPLKPVDPNTYVYREDNNLVHNDGLWMFEQYYSATAMAFTSKVINPCNPGLTLTEEKYDQVCDFTGTENLCGVARPDGSYAVYKCVGNGDIMCRCDIPSGLNTVWGRKFQRNLERSKSSAEATYMTQYPLCKTLDSWIGAFPGRWKFIKGSKTNAQPPGLPDCLPPSAPPPHIWRKPPEGKTNPPCTNDGEICRRHRGDGDWDKYLCVGAAKGEPDTAGEWKNLLRGNGPNCDINGVDNEPCRLFRTRYTTKSTYFLWECIGECSIGYGEDENFVELGCHDDPVKSPDNKCDYFRTENSVELFGECCKIPKGSRKKCYKNLYTCQIPECSFDINKDYAYTKDDDVDYNPADLSGRGGYRLKIQRKHVLGTDGVYYDLNDVNNIYDNLIASTPRTNWTKTNQYLMCGRWCAQQSTTTTHDVTHCEFYGGDNDPNEPPEDKDKCMVWGPVEVNPVIPINIIQAADKKKWAVRCELSSKVDLCGDNTVNSALEICDGTDKFACGAGGSCNVECNCCGDNIASEEADEDCDGTDKEDCENGCSDECTCNP